MGNGGTKGELIGPMGQAGAWWQSLAWAAPCQVTCAGIKSLSSEIADSSQPLATANAKDGETRWLASVIYTASKRIQPQCMVSIIKGEQWETNWCLVRDQIGSFSSASNRQVSSEQHSGHSYTGSCISAAIAPGSHPALSALTALPWNSIWYLLPCQSKWEAEYKIPNCTTKWRNSYKGISGSHQTNGGTVWFSSLPQKWNHSDLPQSHRCTHKV